MFIFSLSIRRLSGKILVLSLTEDGSFQIVWVLWMGEHVQIALPAGSVSHYFNYKTSFSLVLMAIVRIMNLFCATLKQTGEFTWGSD